MTARSPSGFSALQRRAIALLLARIPELEASIVATPVPKKNRDLEFVAKFARALEIDFDFSPAYTLPYLSRLDLSRLARILVNV